MTVMTAYEDPLPFTEFFRELCQVTLAQSPLSEFRATASLHLSASLCSSAGAARVVDRWQADSDLEVVPNYGEGCAGPLKTRVVSALHASEHSPIPACASVL